MVISARLATKRVASQWRLSNVGDRRRAGQGAAQGLGFQPPGRWPTAGEKPRSSTCSGCASSLMSRPCEAFAIALLQDDKAGEFGPPLHKTRPAQGGQRAQVLAGRKNGEALAGSIRRGKPGHQTGQKRRCGIELDQTARGHWQAAQRERNATRPSPTGWRHPDSRSKRKREPKPEIREPKVHRTPRSRRTSRRVRARATGHRYRYPVYHWVWRPKKVGQAAGTGGSGSVQRARLGGDGVLHAQHDLEPPTRKAPSLATCARIYVLGRTINPLPVFSSIGPSWIWTRRRRCA